MRTAALTLLLVILAVPALAADLAVRARLIHTVAGDTIEDGVVLIRDGKIHRVGPTDRVRIPDGTKVIEAAVVTPGFVDSHSTVGLSGVFGGRAGQVRDQDQLEKSDPVQPGLDPMDAYNAADPLVAWIRQFGVTTIHTGHGPGAVISGRTMIVKTQGRSADADVIERDTAIAVTLGTGIDSDFKSPGNRAKAVAMLRKALIDGADYQKKMNSDKPPGRDIGKEVMGKVLDGDIKVLVTAHNAIDISAALRLKREFGLNMLLDGAADAPLLLEEIKAARVPVLLHAPMLRASGDTKNAAFDSALELLSADIPFAYQTGYEGYVPKSRVLLFEAAVAVAHGVAPRDALRAMTLSPAEILGIEKRVGSIERGKDGDLVLFNGDPFEYLTQVCAVVIEGEVVSDECW